MKKAFASDAERLGLKDEQDAVNLVSRFGQSAGKS
jgi:hypothetical protein